MSRIKATSHYFKAWHAQFYLNCDGTAATEQVYSLETCSLNNSLYFI